MLPPQSYSNGLEWAHGVTFRFIVRPATGSASGKKKSYLLKEDFPQIYLYHGIAIFYLNLKDLTNAFLSIIFKIIVKSNHLFF